MDFTQNIRIKFDSKLAFVCRLFSNLQSKVCQTANSLTKMTPLFVILAYGYKILSFGKNETFFLDCIKQKLSKVRVAARVKFANEMIADDWKKHHFLGRKVNEKLLQCAPIRRTTT